MCKLVSKNEFTERVLTKTIEKSIEFLGYAENWRGNKTKLSLLCLICDNAWNTTSVATLLDSNGGCPTCSRLRANLKMVELSRVDDNVVEHSFRATGSFPEESRFWRSERIPGRRDNIGWNYCCPKCSTDEYVQNSLCSGVFHTNSRNLKKGSLPCRCSGRFRWTQQQREFQVKNLCTPIGYSFEGWEGGHYTNTYSKVLLKCPNHEIFSTNILGFLYNGIRCSSCAVTGYDCQLIGYFYFFKVNGNLNFTGYGITNYPEDRLRVHFNNISRHSSFMYDIVVLKFSDGGQARKVEKLVGQMFEPFPQPVDGFRREAINLSGYNDLKVFVNRYDCEVYDEEKYSKALGICA